ncbi:TauD/TfdA family dioxygenase [Nocardia australiensis]|uniref:TauD/TfdA family dioxygenase n=1 Tax=Nocardia australiensis TaxID=2887191 RepID=UPI001D15A431|nr:TauD/TfdA family dioxygenase [Nocardia australiensis]
MKSVLAERMTLHTPNIEQRELPAAAGRDIRLLAAEICGDLETKECDAEHRARTLADPELLEQVDRRVTELPADLRLAMRPPATAAGATIISKLPLTDEECGPTPPSWRDAARWSGEPMRRASSFELDIVMLLLARCAGEPFGWAGQQDGRLVNNIVPSPGHEHEQSGASSKTLLSPHSEDAFHPDRANLLLLACVRNPDRVATTVSSVRHTVLSATQRELLSVPTLPILPDVSYGSSHERYTPTPIPTLWSAESHYSTADLTVRYDPAYTPLVQADAEFRSAYAHLTAELERVCLTAALAPGQMLLVDNDVVVHGRVPFTARYDGTDRWLKRVNVRLPERLRRRGEADENGYGQRIVAPFRSDRTAPLTIGTEPTRAGAGRDTADDRGPVEHS